MIGFFKILKGNNSILQDEYVLFSFDNYQYWNLFGRFFLFVIVFYVSILNRTNRVPCSGNSYERFLRGFSRYQELINTV